MTEIGVVFNGSSSFAYSAVYAVAYTLRYAVERYSVAHAVAHTVRYTVERYSVATL